MKKIPMVYYCLFFIIAFVYAAGAQTMKPDAAKLYNAGNKMMKEGNYEDALKNYNAALKIDKDFRIYYQRGVAFSKNGNLDSAKASYESCLKAKPGFAAAYNALGSVYFAMGKYQDAANNFEKVLPDLKNNSDKDKIKKNLSLVYAKLASELNNEGEHQKAVDALKKAVGYSNYDAAYLELAKTYSDLGKYDDCMTAAQNALKYRTTIGVGGPYYYMGVAYKNKGDKIKAKEMFDKAKADPTYKKLAEYELTSLK